MTTAIEGMELTRVGPGTVMGELMRQYWIPAGLSSELARDGSPLRLMLLGEKLIAFRDSAGRVGVLDHRCPHRCASLFLGRNEEGGLRCIYHGWKFDVAGNCVEMPSVPPHQDFKHKVRAKAYQVVERAGVIWVYMGSRSAAPPLPALEILDVPEDEIRVSFIQRDCNYLQALEGEIDTSHFGFLHAGHVDPEDVAEEEPLRHTITIRAPEYQLADTAWGTQYAGYRPCGPGLTYWRFANFLFPFWTQAPNGQFDSHVHARAWVPLDDGHTMFCFLWWQRGASAMTQQQPAFKDGTPIGGAGRGNIFLPNTTDWLGRWRLAANAGNDWGIDRAAQSNNTIYSGIDGIHLQDQAITESMGPIVDHAFEHLGPSDQMITRTRRRLLRAARALRDDPG
jgi:phenylpropionate dioxygenase-like ring-hydroxylating dioxygenase large terminal subunit